MNEVDLSAVEEAIREPHKFVRRDTVELPIPDSAQERNEVRWKAAHSHGSPELDLDAAKLRAMGQDPGPTLDALLESKNAIHGDFDDDASTAQDLKRIIRAGTNWEAMPAMHREALDNIATKIARILSGDPNHKDHWSDIQGYARLIEKSL